MHKPELLQVSWQGILRGKKADSFSVQISEESGTCNACGHKSILPPFRLLIEIGGRPTVDLRFPTLGLAVNYARKEANLP